jgi:hypothetical protein
MRKQVIEDIRALPIKHRNNKSSDEDKSDGDKSDEEIKPMNVEVVIEEEPKRRKRKANKVKE